MTSKKYLHTLNRLVAIPSVTDDFEQLNKAIDYCQQRLQKTSLHIKRFEQNGYPSLVATSRRTRRPKVFLIAHLDVVPGDEALFHLEQNGDKLIGRGVIDMKYAAAVFLELADKLDELHGLDYGIIFTTDEERGGIDGVKYLFHEVGYSCGVAILPDGGNDWQLEASAKGGWICEASTLGDSAHSSRPWEGTNAIEPLLDFLQAMRGRLPVLTPGDPSLTISMISAGSAVNQVPDHASAIFDIRSASQTELMDIKLYAMETARHHRVTLRTHVDVDAAIADLTSPYVISWQSITAEVLGNIFPRDNPSTVSYGSSDARYLSVRHIPYIVVRPRGGAHHSDEEWLHADDMALFGECLRRYLLHTAASEGKRA